jgi:hypothetical protein
MELAKIAQWANEQDAIVVAKQKEQGVVGDRPNYGAIGSTLTYMFTPTSIGTIVKVVHGVTKAELDLTDYDWW